MVKLSLLKMHLQVGNAAHLIRAVNQNLTVKALRVQWAGIENFQPVSRQKQHRPVDEPTLNRSRTRAAPAPTKI